MIFSFSLFSSNLFLYYSTDDPDTSVLCESLWKEILSTLSYTLQSGGVSTLEGMTPVMIRNWQIITGKLD